MYVQVVPISVVLLACHVDLAAVLVSEQPITVHRVLVGLVLEVFVLILARLEHSQVLGSVLLVMPRVGHARIRPLTVTSVLMGLSGLGQTVSGAVDKVSTSI